MDKLIAIFEAFDPTTVDLAAAHRTSEGINFMINSGKGALPHYNFDQIIKILVREEDAKRAMEILKDEI